MHIDTMAEGNNSCEEVVYAASGSLFCPCNVNAQLI